MAPIRDLAKRTEAFAVCVVRFSNTLPSNMAGRSIAQQLLKAGTSVAANYRAACRAYTRPLFISKLATVAEEADESEFWLRLLVNAGLTSPETTADLVREAGELSAIFTAAMKTARGGRLRDPQRSS